MKILFDTNLGADFFAKGAEFLKIVMEYFAKRVAYLLLLKH